jgi:hypothetical protein
VSSAAGNGARAARFCDLRIRKHRTSSPSAATPWCPACCSSSRARPPAG